MKALHYTKIMTRKALPSVLLHKTGVSKNYDEITAFNKENYQI